MDDVYVTKSVQVVAYQWLGEVVESNQVPDAPKELSERFQRRTRMALCGTITHGGPLQWEPIIWDGRKRIRVRKNDWVVLHPNGQLFVLSNEVFHDQYERVQKEIVLTMVDGADCVLHDGDQFEITNDGSTWWTIYTVHKIVDDKFMIVYEEGEAPILMDKGRLQGRYSTGVLRKIE